MRQLIRVCLLVTVLSFAPTLTAVAQFGGPNPVLTKTMTPSPPAVGKPARITITAANAGTANADNVVITDPVPDNMALAGVTASQGTVVVSRGIVTVYVGTLAPGQTATVISDVVITRAFANDTPYTNCAGLTFRDGTARLACFPFGPAFGPVSVASPPQFLPDAGAPGGLLPLSLILIGSVGLLVGLRLRLRR